MRAIVKIGTSSLTDEGGLIDASAVQKLCDEVAVQRALGHEIVLVTSAAIAAGLAPLGLSANRPKDALTLQAVSAIGQSRLMHVYNVALERHGLIGAQVLLTPLDFMLRAQYLHARDTLERIIELGVIAIINENDAIADDEIRFGDNDRIAALVANLLNADVLILLTDTGGLYTADPRTDPAATLIDDVEAIDDELQNVAGGAGTARGSGGMASKVSAARMASWSGVRTVIAAARRDNVVGDAMGNVPGVGTTIRAKSRDRKLAARKLWIGFAAPGEGTVTIDAGAEAMLISQGVSLLHAGVVAVAGDFAAQDPIDVVNQAGRLIARGLASVDSRAARASLGRRSSDLDSGVAAAVIHRDDLVVLV